MAVSLRQRPVLTGKEAKLFIEKNQKNEELMKKHAEKKMKEYHERLSHS